MTDQAFLEKNLNEIIKSGIPKAINIDGKRIYISKKIINKMKDVVQQTGGLAKDRGTESEALGGLLPLAALLPIIFGALGAAGGVAGGVANVVQSAKTSQKADAEKKLAEEQLKKLKKENESKKEEGTGGGIFLNPYKGKGISDFLKNILKKSNLEKPEKTNLKNKFKNFKNGIKIENSSGSGLFLNPYKNEVQH